MKIDTIIEDVAYIHDCLVLLKKIQSTGNCIMCKANKCKYRPKSGEMVRYNCPFYEPMWLEQEVEE